MDTDPKSQVPTPTPIPVAAPSYAPASPHSAGDDAALQAIEALEAESNAIPALETDRPSASMMSPMSAVTPAPVSTPKITEPLIPTSPATDVTPPASVPPSPAASALTDSLKDEPAVASDDANFQPFATPVKKSGKKRTLILVIVLVVVLLAGGGYFAWQFFMQPAPAKTQTTTQTTTTEDTTPAITDTESDVTAAATTMGTQTSTMDDTEYDDGTLSDNTLYN